MGSGVVSIASDRFEFQKSSGRPRATFHSSCTFINISDSSNIKKNLKIFFREIQEESNNVYVPGVYSRSIRTETYTEKRKHTSKQQKCENTRNTTNAWNYKHIDRRAILRTQPHTTPPGHTPDALPPHPYPTPTPSPTHPPSTSSGADAFIFLGGEVKYTQ